MTAPETVEEIAKHSVTGGDVFDYIPGSGGVTNLILPWFWFNPSQIGTLSMDLPEYWSQRRDAVLRATIIHESFWAAAISIATVKSAAMGFEFDGPPRQVERCQSLMLQWSGQGYVPSMEKGVTDFLTQDNGEFHEVVRASSAAGSRILGLVHLDSARCTRTGDPDIPVLYRDLHGRLHEMRDYQVIHLADQPDPGFAWFGVGHCAASRAYPHIFRLAALERYVTEKLTGAGASKLTILRGITTEQIRTLIATSDIEKRTKGLVYYQGSILAGILGDMNLEKVEIELKGLPENFERKQELDIGLLAYADAIGLDPQDLQPLSGAGLGTGTQSRVLWEKAKGRWPAARTKQLTHLLNEWVFPESTTFYFQERDLTDELKQAEVVTARAGYRKAMKENGEISALQSLQMAADSGDVPAEFVPQDITPDQQIDDEERVEDDTETATNPAAPTEKSYRLGSDARIEMAIEDLLSRAKELMEKDDPPPVIQVTVPEVKVPTPVVNYRPPDITVRAPEVHVEPPIVVVKGAEKAAGEPEYEYEVLEHDAEGRIVRWKETPVTKETRNA